MASGQIQPDPKKITVKQHYTVNRGVFQLIADNFFGL